ncbi:MAG: hypothetical protein O7A62_15640, partial [Alphaproteobacteria bacterium]|nr:hypothetical protein [Alphaproteobacteria bacterium]
RCVRHRGRRRVGRVEVTQGTGFLAMIVRGGIDIVVIASALVVAKSIADAVTAVTDPITAAVAAAISTGISTGITTGITTATASTSATAFSESGFDFRRIV